MTKFLTAISIFVMANMFYACAPAPSTAERPSKKPDKSSNQTPGQNTPGTTTPGTVVTPGDTPTEPDPIDPKDPVVVDPTDPDPKDPVVVVPPEEPVANLNFTGGIDVMNTFVRVGEITGWAVDKDNLKNYLSVNIYFDGDNKTGTKAGSSKANLVGVDDNNGGEHAFIFTVPNEFINSMTRKVYAYAVVNGIEVPLSSKQPYTMTFFKPRGGAAQAKYNEIGFQNGCKGCHHSFSYADRWDKLVQDGFSGKDWAESTNFLYEKVTSSHKSVTRDKPQPCQHINCEKLKEWWRLEFVP